MDNNKINNKQNVKIINKNLTDFEKKVLFEKWTEAPFSGIYENFFDEGIYICKNCGIPLYTSKDKFKSGCGWPAFDDEIPGAIKKQPDADGRRTEILCAYCGSHLGHIFYGEGFTSKNTRHCVNSVSLNFIYQNSIKENNQIKLNRMFFAAGCFWGVQELFKKLNGVVYTRVGYMGGHKINPTYEEVCRGITGHLETVMVIYDTFKIKEEDLIKYFFEIHNFSQENGQGPDIGEQYKSAIFYIFDFQREIAEKIKYLLINNNYKVATEIRKASQFFEAEEYHQDYYQKLNEVPYCHYRRNIFNKE
ncbi:MAG: bifunctional methionine sulfoxide reductase B/A protein [Spirochaetes bacterium]|nr:bifunctional methionine sulfoxide reductase B/A protein [Spirochaetota bacterium]